VSLDHEAVVEHAGFGEIEASDFVAEDDAGYDGGAGGAETAAQRDGVVDVDVRCGGECALVVAFQDVEGGAGDEICLRIKWNACILWGRRCVAYTTVLWVGRGFGRINGHVELEPDGKSKTDHVEAGAWKV